MRLLRFQSLTSCCAIALTLLSPICSTAQARPQGYWHTRGNRILDDSGRPVRIAGINWYGFETPNGAPGGLYAQDYKVILGTIRAQGFNTVRLPFSSQMLEAPGPARNISFFNAGGPINVELRGLDSLQVLDRIVEEARRLGLKIILDHHRSEAGDGAEPSGLWYTDAYPESTWIADWTTLADRYFGNSAVIGFDLHNEPHTAAGGGACWDCGGPNDWHLAAERAGDAILGVNPSLLIFVEGNDIYRGDSYWWGGNLEGAANSPVRLAVSNRLVYSAHDYGPQESGQAWFNGTTDYASLGAVWTRHWAYLSQQNIAPVWLAEFGTTNDAASLGGATPGSQGQWFESLIRFLGNDPTINWTSWAVNGEDRYAYLDRDYSTRPASATKASMLAGIRSTTPGTFLVPGTTSASAAANASPASAMALLWTLLGGSGLTFAIFVGSNKSEGETAVPETCAGAPKQLPRRRSDPVSMETIPPAAPAGLLAIPVNSRQISLTWKPSETAGVTYTIHGGSQSGAQCIAKRNVLAAGLGCTSYLVAGLHPGTPYQFEVRAMLHGLASGPSNMADGITGECRASTKIHLVPMPAEGLDSAAV